MTDYFAKDPTTPDLSSVSIAICTPSNGTYEKSYVNSLYGTMREIERLGGKCQLFEFAYCADLSFSRAVLLGKFHRSSHTHVLFIDSDMGWKPEDVVKTLLFDRDFVAAAGPKKRYPLTFAANQGDDFGNSFPLLQEGTGLMEFAEVGFAFVLLSRACVERMIQSYPELQFKTDETTTEVALFDPIIENNRRLSEDYAFCRRWRKTGGKIHINPYVELSHTGAHTFSGALIDIFEDEDTPSSVEAGVGHVEAA